MYGGYTFGAKFVPGFDMKLLRRQAGNDRWVYNRLPETPKESDGNDGMVNCTHGRTSKWYTDLRNATPFLQGTVSQISRDKLFRMGRHYSQYAATERRKAAGVTPDAEFGEPRFKKHGDPVSVPLTISHGNGIGSAKFVGDRTMGMTRLGGIKLSRPFPVPNHRPMTATPYQTRCGKWRIEMTRDVDEPDTGKDVEPRIIGIDRNVGNTATPDEIIMPLERVVKRLDNLGHTTHHTQRIMSRRHPNRKTRMPGPNRHERARVMHARRKREAANVPKGVVRETARAMLNAGATYVVLEHLRIKNMTKSAKDTKEKPGKQVRQKSGLNHSIMWQGWGLLGIMPSYDMVGDVIGVDPTYTSLMCLRCSHTDKNNRSGRALRCMSCGFMCHADIIICNIENGGRLKLGLEPRLPVMAGSAQATYSLDAEDGIASGVHPASRQARTRVEHAIRAVRLWDYAGKCCMCGCQPRTRRCRDMCGACNDTLWIYRDRGGRPGRSDPVEPHRIRVIIHTTPHMRTEKPLQGSRVTTRWFRAGWRSRGWRERKPHQRDQHLKG